MQVVFHHAQPNCANNQSYRSSFPPTAASYRHSCSIYPAKNSADNPTVPITRHASVPSDSTVPHLSTLRLPDSFLNAGPVRNVIELGRIIDGAEECRQIVEECIIATTQERLDRMAIGCFDGQN